MTNFAEALGILVERRSLGAAGMRWFVERMIAGEMDELESATLLTALRMKGETAEELAAAAGVLRDRMIPLETGRDGLLDTCGTGGDSSGTFNISTATALLTAACGVPVVKHGNRAVSSRSGSADVLTELGINLEGDPSWARRCLDEAGLAFCYAPYFHPALARLAPLRRRLRIRTLFNCVGPLVNPAGAAYQLLGAGRCELLDPLAGALALLGTRRALVVWSRDGLDEVSLSAPTLVRDVCDGKVTSREWTAEDFGLEPCSVGELRADGPRESARMIMSVLDGQDGPARRVVLANTAAALLAAGRVHHLADGVRTAAAALDSGKGRRILGRLVALSQAGGARSSAGAEPSPRCKDSA